MKQRIVIDVIYTKHIEVEVPDVKGTEDCEIMEKAVAAELEALPEEVNGFYYGWESWEEV